MSHGLLCDSLTHSPTVASGHRNAGPETEFAMVDHYFSVSMQGFAAPHLLSPCSAFLIYHGAVRGLWFGTDLC